jgi:hypothetical protein
MEIKEIENLIRRIYTKWLQKGPTIQVSFFTYLFSSIYFNEKTG